MLAGGRRGNVSLLALGRLRSGRDGSVVPSSWHACIERVPFCMGPMGPYPHACGYVPTWGLLVVLPVRSLPHPHMWYSW